VDTVADRVKKKEWLKRSFDLILAYFLLVVFSPVFLLIYFIVRMEIGAPVFFRQMRPGKNGKPFMIVKFRTMTDERGENGILLPEAERIRPFGIFLRKMSLDELPELVNVIKGQMSFVGPRPLLMQYLNYYTPYYARRHNVKPGITGWAQIHGRNNTPFSRRFTMDVWYVDHYSFLFDLKIIILTIGKVFKRENVRADLEQCYREVNDCGLPDTIIMEENYD
jgi:sugar transferase EpsL